MTVKNKYILGGVSFSSKEKILKYAQNILKRTDEQVKLLGADFDFVVDLVKMHPKKDRKIGQGIASIQVLPNPHLSGKGFVIHRIDGTTERFSYRACLEHCRVSKKNSATRAFRYAIRFQIQSAKESLIVQLSQGQGCIWSDPDQSYIKVEDAALDHYPTPFADIMESFLRAEGVTVNDIKTTSGAPEQLIDRSLELRWQQYHEKHAQYRLVSAKLNSFLGRHSV